MNVDAGDRLSSLSDDLIHKIFSSVSTKLVVQTSALSSRWRFIWTSIPYLNLSTEDFPTWSKLSEFVTRFLSRRNSELTEVSSVKLNLRQKVSEGFVKEIMEYVLICRAVQNPRSMLKVKSIWELPALTTLYLRHLFYPNDANGSFFSGCANLKNLTLETCQVVDSEKFSICHSRLSNLTLDNSFVRRSVNVVAPKLENLTIRTITSYFVVVVSAPDLAAFVYKGEYWLHLSTDGFNSLKKADICVKYPSNILSLLHHLHNVKFLTLNMEIILELLSSYEGQILPRPFMFTNLKRLKICPKSVPISPEQAPNKSYFLDTSPGATLEEIVAQSLVVELQVILEEEKTKMFEQGTRLETGESIAAKNKSYRENQRLKIEKRKSLVNSKLWSLEGLLAGLPASKRAMIQPMFASVCAEVLIVRDGWKKRLYEDSI